MWFLYMYGKWKSPVGAVAGATEEWLLALVSCHGDPASVRAPQVRRGRSRPEVLRVPRVMDSAAQGMQVLHQRFATTGWGMQGAWSVPMGKMTFNLTCLLNNSIILSGNTSSYSKINALFLTYNLLSWQACTSFNKLTVYHPH